MLDAPGIGGFLRAVGPWSAKSLLHENNMALRNKIPVEIQKAQNRFDIFNSPLARKILRSMPILSIAPTCPDYVIEMDKRYGRHISATPAQIETIIANDPELRAMADENAGLADNLATEKFMFEPLEAASASAEEAWAYVQHVVASTQGELRHVFEHLWRRWSFLPWLQENANDETVTLASLRNEPLLHDLVKRSPSIDLRMGEQDLSALRFNLDFVQTILVGYGGNIERLALRTKDTYRESYTSSGHHDQDKVEAIAVALRLIGELKSLKHLVLDVLKNEHGVLRDAFAMQPDCLKGLHALVISCPKAQTWVGGSDPLWSLLDTHGACLRALTLQKFSVQAESLAALATLGARLDMLAVEAIVADAADIDAATADIKHLHIGAPEASCKGAFATLCEARRQRGLTTTSE